MSHAMHPLIVLSVYFQSVSHSCNTKGRLASFTHYTCIRFFSLSLFFHSVSFFFFFCAKALSYSAHLFSSTLLFQGPEGASLCVLYFLLSSFSVAHHSFSVHEGVHNNIINTQHSGHTECNDPWLLTTCLIVIFLLMSSCVMAHLKGSWASTPTSLLWLISCWRSSLL